MKEEKQYFPKITANSVEQFKALEEVIKQLPQSIIDQIECVDVFTRRTQCHLKEQFTKEPTLYLPNTVTQISNFEKYIGIYCDKDLFFTYPKNDKDQLFPRYIFYDISKLIKSESNKKVNP